MVLTDASLRSMGTDMVDIYVGPKNKHFLAHKELLCNKILYFKKMFKGGFQEASSSKANFPEDDPEGFDVLISWVYQENCHIYSSKQETMA